jgi:hypothetical protein
LNGVIIQITNRFIYEGSDFETLAVQFVIDGTGVLITG